MELTVPLGTPSISLVSREMPLEWKDLKRHTRLFIHMPSCSVKPQNSSCSGLPHSTASLSSQKFFSPSSYHCLCFYPRLQTHTHTHTHKYIHFPMSSVRARKATEEREVVRASPTLQLYLCLTVGHWESCSQKYGGHIVLFPSPVHSIQFHSHW